MVVEHFCKGSPNLNVLLVTLCYVVVQGEQEGEGEEEAEALEKKLEYHLQSQFVHLDRKCHTSWLSK